MALKMRALVLEGIVRECLAVVRSLGRHGVEVDVGDPSRINPARFSKYVSRFFRYPDPKERPDHFFRWLLDHIKRHSYDMVFPLNDYTYEVCTQYQDELLRYTHLGINSWDTFELARDKGKTIEFAAEAGVPIPQTWCPKSEEELRAVLDRLPPYPLLMKPAKSSGSRGLKVVHDEKELYAHFRKLSATYGRMLIQEFIPGKDILDVTIICNMRSKVRGALVSNRIRMFPVEAGPNVAGHAVFNEPLRQSAVRFVESLGWKGVCQVEFKVDERDGIPKLMEINPRFWGSTQLGISSGIDFPWMLFEAAVGGDCAKKMEYRTDILVRWLIPGELLHLMTRKSLKGLWPDFFRFFDKNTVYYVFDASDLKPTLGLFLTLVMKLFDRRMVRYFLMRN
jgi:predicted ATP-grasp superfamily ATP-dependent carboligase